MEQVNWTALRFDEVSPVVKGVMAEAYGHILQAEKLGLRVVQRLAEAAPEGALRDAARAQLRDELRHVEFFSRVAAALGGGEVSAPNLALLERESAGLKDYTALMTLTQVMENAANALFSGYARHSLGVLRRNIRLPGSDAMETLLLAVTEIVGKDEGLHVAHGLRVLRARYAGLSAHARRVLEEQVQVESGLMLAACAEVGKSYRRLGFGERAVLGRVALAQHRFWRHLDIDASGVVP